jgi:hypothetical protein
MQRLLLLGPQSGRGEGVGIESGRIGVGCWPRTTGVSNNKKAMAQMNIGESFAAFDSQGPQFCAEIL